MKVEIIAVGNEVITGKTINTNATYIARQIQNIGLKPLYHSAVIDEKEYIEEALMIALKRADIIIFTGGLGPTKDDLTKEVVCESLNKPLILYEELWEEIKSYFKKTGRMTPENNKKQACFPKDCVIIPNNNGTAPGAIIECGNQYVVILPGPPKELKPMLDETVIPHFTNKQEGIYHTIDVKTFGIGESHLVELIPDLLGEYEGVEVAPYIGEYEIILRIRSFGKSEEEALKKAKNLENKLTNRLEEYIIGYNESKLEENILQYLEKNNYTIATAESCTGGLLAGKLINCSGISKYFKEGVISYSNEAKEKYLEVRKETLVQYGAVSHQTAQEMAKGIKKMANTTIGLSTTGIAGPEGGTTEKPVGLVYIGMAIGDECYIHELHLQGDRQAIRDKTVKYVLYYLYKQLNQ